MSWPQGPPWRSCVTDRLLARVAARQRSFLRAASANATVEGDAASAASFHLCQRRQPAGRAPPKQWACMRGAVYGTPAWGTQAAAHAQEAAHSDITASALDEAAVMTEQEMLLYGTEASTSLAQMGDNGGMRTPYGRGAAGAGGSAAAAAFASAAATPNARPRVRRNCGGGDGRGAEWGGSTTPCACHSSPPTEPDPAYASPLQNALQAWGWAPPRRTNGTRIDQIDAIEALLRQLQASHMSLQEEVRAQRVQLGALESMRHEQQLMRGDIQALGKALGARWPLKGKDVRV